MDTIETITLDDGITYAVVDEKIYNGIKYVYLVDRNNELNFCIRKIKIENGKEYIINLDDRKEFELALNILTR